MNPTLDKFYVTLVGLFDPFAHIIQGFFIDIF